LGGALRGIASQGNIAKILAESIYAKKTAEAITKRIIKAINY